MPAQLLTASAGVLARPGHVGWVMVDGRAVVMHLPTARRAVLSGPATQVWRRVERGATADEVVASLAHAHPEAPLPALTADVTACLEDLLARGLLERRT